MPRHRQVNRLERFAALFLQDLECFQKKEKQKADFRLYLDARVHAANFALIACYSQPKVDEPLSTAWARCRASNLPKTVWLQHCLDEENPFDDELYASSLAEKFRYHVLAHAPGGDELEKLSAIFAAAPAWLIWFTGADCTATVLNLELPDLSKICQFVRSHKTFTRWPLLPSGELGNRTRPIPQAASRAMTDSALSPDESALALEPRPTFSECYHEERSRRFDRLLSIYCDDCDCDDD